MPTAAGLNYIVQNGEISEKPPLVLIHGAGASHSIWPAELLKIPGRRVYAVDLPGHGGSPGSGQLSIFTYADRLAGFLQAAQIPQAVFVGHSMGAAIALAIGLEYPEMAAGLALISCAAVLDVPTNLIDMSAAHPTRPIAVEGLVERSFSAQTPQHLVESTVHWLLSLKTGTLHGDLLACEAFDVRELIQRINVPVLVACGSEDRLAPPSAAHLLVARIPTARLRLFYGAGHMLILEQPAALAASLVQFLDEVATPLQ